MSAESEPTKAANSQSLEVTNLRENLNDYRFVISRCDALLNPTDEPVKAALFRGVFVTLIYGILLMTNVSITVKHSRITQIASPINFGIFNFHLAVKLDTFIRAGRHLPNMRRVHRKIEWQGNTHKYLHEQLSNIVK